MATFTNNLFAAGTQPLTATRAVSPTASAGAQTATQAFTAGAKSLMPGASVPAGSAAALAPKPLPTSPLAPSGYAPPVTKPQATVPRPPNPAVSAAFGTMQPPTSGPLASPTAQSPLQDPGNNLVNQGYGEQALNYTQNRLLEDPAAGQLQTQYNNANTPTQGQNYMNQNLGTLDGAGQGDQYWNQVQGQFNDPFAGEQFARQQSQAMGAQGAAGAFNTSAQARSDQFTNFQGAGNTQGAYGQAQQQLAGGSQGEQGMSQIAGQYGNLGQYNGPNQAQGQYQQNAASGPMQMQQFNQQVQGQFGTTGTYSDPNLSAGQYAQTQQAFGDLPIANFDPFYDRASQLGVQNYNKQAAGRGVYGSSEALSGVGNVITDIEAQRANRSFDAEMQRAVEQRNRQALLGQQAQMGDQSSIAGFNAGLAGVNTFGNLAQAAGQENLGQQTMLGTQARNADISATDAFRSNLEGATTFSNINQGLANTELDRTRVLGDLANNADSQALGAQQANISGMNTLSNAASNADSAETNRFQARTNAMNQADRTGLDRLNSGVSNALGVDANARGDFQASQSAAAAAAGLDQGSTRLAADIADRASGNDLDRLNAFNNTSQNAEQQRQSRQLAKLTASGKYSETVSNAIQQAGQSMDKYGADAFEDWVAAEIAPSLQDAQMSAREKKDLMDGLRQTFDDAHDLAD